MKSVSITLHNAPDGIDRHPIGFRLLKPDGIIFIYDSGTYTMTLDEADFTVEVKQHAVCRHRS